MPQLYRIGEFAQASGLTVKALRHYARLGLLTPVRVDARTGYRYYDVVQLETVEEIRGLVRLGLPLARVREHLGGAPPVSLRAALLSLRATVQERLRADRDRLAAIEARIRELERLPPPRGHHVFLARQPERMVGTVRDRIADYAGADLLLAEVRDVLRDRDRSTGPLTGVIWHDCGKATGTIDCESLVAVGHDHPASVGRPRRFRIRRLPGAVTACVVHCGTDATISAAYAAARSWIGERGLVPGGPVREWYLQGSCDAADSVTEIHVPVVRRGRRA